MANDWQKYDLIEYLVKAVKTAKNTTRNIYKEKFSSDGKYKEQHLS